MNPVRARIAAAAAGALVLSAGTLASALPASAAPLTSSASLPPNLNMGVTFSDVDLAPGDTVTVDFTFMNVTDTPDSYAYGLGSAIPEPDDGEFDNVFELDGCVVPDTLGIGSGCRGILGGERLEVRANSLPSKTTTITATLTVKDDATPGVYTLPQEVTGLTGSTTAFNPPATFTVSPAPSANLSADLTASAPLLLGGAITYTATASNAGPGTAAETQIITNLPNRVTSVSNLPSGCTSDTDSGTVTCDVGDIPSGGSEAVTFRGNLGLLSIGLALNATASVSSVTPDPVASNNHDDATCTVVTGLVILC